MAGLVAALGNLGRGPRAVRVWDARTARVIQTMEVDFFGSLHFGLLAFSSDSQTVFGGGSGSFLRRGGWPMAAAVAGPSLGGSRPDCHRRLARWRGGGHGLGLCDDAVRIWSAAKGELIATLAGHTAWTGDLRFSADGKRLLTAAADQTLRVWDTTTWREVAVLRGHGDEVHAAAFTPDGQFVASGSKDGEILLWSLAAAPDRARPYRFPPEVRWVNALPGVPSALLIRDDLAPAIMNLVTRESRPLKPPGRWLLRVSIHQHNGPL